MGVIAVMRMIEERDGDFVMRPLVSRFGLLLDVISQIPASGHPNSWASRP